MLPIRLLGKRFAAWSTSASAEIPTPALPRGISDAIDDAIHLA